MGWSGQNNTSRAASVTQSRNAELISLAQNPTASFRVSTLNTNIRGARSAILCSKPFEIFDKLYLQLENPTSLHRIPEKNDVLDCSTS